MAGVKSTSRVMTAGDKELSGSPTDHDVADTVAVEHLHEAGDVRELRYLRSVGGLTHWGRRGRLCAIAWRASS
jgi:hypothetical protein